MKEFKKRGDFGGKRPFKSFRVEGRGDTRGDDRGGRDFRGGARGRSFGASNFNRGNFGGPTEMHQAVCARCGKTCEVPFRPNGRKPVFCKECFGQQDGAPAHARRDDARRDERPSFAPHAHTHAPSHSHSHAPAAAPDYKAQFEQMNAKIDTLTRMVKALGAQAVVATPAADQVVVATLKVSEGDAPAKPKAKKAKKA